MINSNVNTLSVIELCHNTIKRLISADALIKYKSEVSNINAHIENILYKISEYDLKSDNYQAIDARLIYEKFALYIHTNGTSYDLSSREQRTIALYPPLFEDIIVFRYFLNYSKVNFNKIIFRIFISHYLRKYDEYSREIIKSLQEYFHACINYISSNELTVTTNLESVIVNKDILFSTIQATVHPAQLIIQHLRLDIVELLMPEKLKFVIVCISDILKLGIGGDIHSKCIELIIPKALKKYDDNQQVIVEYLLNIKIAYNKRKFLSPILAQIIIYLEQSGNNDNKEKFINHVFDLKESNNHQDHVISNEDDHALFGDPRSCDWKWSDIKGFKPSNSDRNAKEIFTSWLYKKYIEFFFDVLFNDDYGVAQDRKTFWIQYIKKLQYAKFFVSDCDEYKHEEKLLEARQNWGLTYSKLKRSKDSSDGSIFVMRFRDFYIIEATQKNLLALRIYRLDSDKVKNIESIDKVSLSTSTGGLKSTNGVEYLSSEWDAKYADITQDAEFGITHGNEWQKITRAFLNKHGINPD